MSDNNKKVDEKQQGFSDVSKVNPDKHLKKIRDKGGLAVVIVICLIMTGFILSPSKAKQVDKLPPPVVNDNSDTLSKNLAIIEQMKKQPEMNTIEPVVPHKKPSKHHQEKKLHLSKEIRARMNAPTTLINNERAAPYQASHAGGDMGDITVAQSGFVNINADSQYMNQQGDIATVSARKMPHPEFMVPAGEMIPATLGVAMNSELPGMILAVTERNIYSLTGDNILIPRGSRLVGQYNASIVQGQSRFLVVWNRVQLPNGVIVSINSPGADNLGRAGMAADSIDRHFMERFGESTLLSIIGAFAANEGVNGNTQYNSASEYRAAMAASFNQTAQQTFARNSQIKPTLDKFQGAEITVFVAKDLDFSSVGRQTPPRVVMARGAAWK